MDFNKFCQMVQSRLCEEFPSDTLITISEILKNNGIVNHMLIIHEKNISISPTINLTEIYDSLDGEWDFDAVIYFILDVYHTHKISENISPDFFTDFSQSSPNIIFKLVNMEKNAQLLETVPHKCFMDLAIIFYYSMPDHPQLSNGGIMITNDHLKLWDKKADDLYDIAMKNTPYLFPLKISTMEEILSSVLKSDLPPTIMDTVPPMYILSNSSYTNGAACLLYPSVLSNISVLLSDDFYIIPSSIHECLIIPSCCIESPDDTADMIRTVNATEVPENEVLSDNLYMYSRKLDEVFICN